MQHRHSEGFLQQQLPRDFFSGVRPVATALGVLALLALVTVPLAGWASFWVLIAVLGAATVFGVRTGWGRPAAMRVISYEVDRHGLWRQRRSRRKLLLGRAELASIEVYRTRLNEISRVELRSRTRRVQLEGLENMESFVQDLRQQFPRAPLQEHRPGDPRG